MALKIGKKTTRKVKVTAEEPLDFAGVAKHIFDVEYKVLGKEKTDGIRAMDEAGEHDVAIDEIFDSIVNVEGVQDENNAAVPYSDDVKALLKETPWVRSAIMQFFWVVQNGVTQPEMYKRLKQKN